VVKKLAGFLLISAMLAPLAPAWGQEEAKPEKPLVIDEVVVTATRTEVPGKETSVSYTVITGQEIEDRQAIMAPEVLRTVPGVNITQQGSRGGLTSLFLRGGNSNHTQVLLNGIRLNDAGGDFDFSSLTTDNVDRVEVIRGPMSALYGADAMSGVVNFVTRKGAGPPRLTLTSGWGVHSETGGLISEQRASLMGAHHSFGYSIGFSRVDDQGILRLNNRFASTVLNSRLDYDPMEKLSFTFTTLMVDQRLGVPTELGGDRFDPRSVGGPGLDPQQKNTRLDMLLGLTTRYQPYTWWENFLTLAHSQRDRHFNDPRNPEFTELDRLFGAFFSRNLERRWSLDYHTNLRVGSRQSVESISTLGVAARTEQLKQSLLFGPVPPFFPGSGSFLKTSRTSTALYAQEQLKFWQRLFLTVGLRVEDNSVFDRVEVTPRASAAFRITETDTTIRAAGGRAIKEPTFLESFSRDQLTKANPKLRPEKNLGWEVGADQFLLQERFKLSISYFENHFTDLITFVPRTYPELSSFENIGAVRTKGLEFALRARLMKGVTLGAAYTYFTQFTVLDDGQVGGLFFQTGHHLLRRPRNNISFILDAKRPRWGFNLVGLYVGRRDDSMFTFQQPFTFQSARVVNPGYFTLNLAAYYDLAQDLGQVKKVRLMVRANNLLDRNYMEAFGYSSPRFHAVGGLQVVF